MRAWSDGFARNSLLKRFAPTSFEHKTAANSVGVGCRFSCTRLRFGHNKLSDAAISVEAGLGGQITFIAIGNFDGLNMMGRKERAKTAMLLMVNA